MECEVSPENGPSCSKTGKEVSRLQKFKYEHEYVGGSDVRLDFPIDVLCKISNQQMYLSVAPHDRSAYQTANNNVPTDNPFMNNMDEISYWIYTKRAPCLMNYDNLIKKQNEEANTSKSNQKSVPNAVQEVPSPKKKKKRKLLSLSDDSISDNNHKNVYFDNSQRQNRKTEMSSDGLGSDIDFDIKNSSVQVKPKKPKLQKHSKTILHKKNKLITSTPKVPYTSLRRSLRQKERSMNNSHNKISLMFNSSIVNGSGNLKNNITLDNNSTDKVKQQSEMLAEGDQSCDKKNTTKVNLKNDILNGQFEGLSDMSGFTANYIRSTKVQSKKSPRKLRCKTSKNLIKESRQNEEKDNTTLVCINKSVNTKLTKNQLLNCSTDSSQNVINLVTTKNNDKSPKMDNSTSALKILDKTKNKEYSNDNNDKSNLNITIQSTTSRYPRRNKNAKINYNIHSDINSKNASKNSVEFDNSDRKENPEEKLALRTRSGRNVGLKLHQHENSVLVLSNSTEHMSSTASLNLASPNGKLKKKKHSNNRAVRAIYARKNGKAMQRDLGRDKSGFMTCFSDSDDDSEPLQRKFFCA